MASNPNPLDGTSKAMTASYEASHLHDVSGFYPIPHAAMHEVGPAAIALGLMYYVADAKTFTTYKSIQTLASYSAIPGVTIKRQFGKLCSTGWMENQGRQAPSGTTRKRRSATYQLTTKARTSKTPYAPWPRWLACWPSWLSREQTLIYAVLLNRQTLVEKIRENEAGNCDERLYVSQAEIHRATGFSRNTIQRAIEMLTDPAGPLLEKAEPWDCSGYTAVLPDFAPDRLK